MKRSVRRETTIFVVVLATLTIVTAYCAWRLQAANATLAIAAENERQMQQLAVEIQRMRGGDQRAALTATSVAEISARVESAARAAELPLDQLVRIDPQPAQRVGETNYRQQTTRVELQGVTIEQLVTLLDGCIGEHSNWVVPHLRLTAPREMPAGTSQEVWQVEMDLTQFVFAPTNPSPRRG